jgi:hypothetical protein
MARKKATDEAMQLTLDLLLEQEPDKLHKLPIDPEDIGGELLAVLSKGLYTNPLDAIREYVQNCVDARSQNVTIKITGNSVIVYDDGNGMDLEDLLRARQFGLSPKLYEQHVGFRGIGIYSGFDLCRRLRVTSTKAGGAHAHVLVFDFAAMKAQLDSERGRETQDGKTSLIKLLSEHTYIERLSSAFTADQHFTQVELQDISDFHIRQLSNRAELKRYLLQNLPIDFDTTFDSKRVINDHLFRHVPGYNPITIILQSDGQDDEIVSKYGGVTLQPPTFGYIRTRSGQQVAYYWACLTSRRGHIDKKRPTDGPQYEGFVYKCKGFSIGDRGKLRDMFVRKPQLYTWYTGEVYVLDPSVVPNAERNDFETSQAKLALEMAIKDEFDERLLPEAETWQAQGVAHDHIEAYLGELAAIETRLLGTAPSEMAESYATDFQTYSRLDKILDDMKRQRKVASSEDRPIAEDVVRRAERLQKQLRREADSPPDDAGQRRKATRVRRVEPAPPAQLSIPAVMPIERTLPGILEDIGWPTERSCAKVIGIIQESMEEVLGISSSHYRNLLSLIESRLNSASLDE